jgi:hypothetical protein
LTVSLTRRDDVLGAEVIAPSVALLRDPNRFLEFGSNRRRQSILASMAFETVLIDDSLDR